MPRWHWRSAAAACAAPAPLFSALLNYRHSRSGRSNRRSAKPGKACKCWAAEERTNYPLTLSVDDLGEGFGLTAQVVAGVQAQRICDYMHTALEHLVEALERAPHTPVQRIEVLPSSSVNRLLVEWNATEAEYPQRQLHP